MINRMMIKRKHFFDDIIVINLNPFAQIQDLSNHLSESKNKIQSELI